MLKPIIRITHWLPILTFCPVNGLPDFIFITLTFKGFIELYSVRRAVRKLVSMRTMFMEDIAELVHNKYPEADVQVRLWFNKHCVELKATNVPVH